jgi:adenosine deaminase
MCASETPVTQAIERIIGILPGWTKAKEAENAELVVLHHEDGFALSPDMLRFYHEVLGTRLVVVDTATHKPYTSNSACGNGDHNWLFNVTDSAKVIPELLEWVQQPYNPFGGTGKVPTAGDCRNLVASALTASNLGSLRDFIQKDWAHFFEANDCAAFYFSLLRICQNQAEIEHDWSKNLDQELFASANSAEKEFLTKQRQKRFRECCEDIRKSLASRILPPSNDCAAILLIDDKPEEYLELLAKIQKSFLFDEYKIWVLKLDDERQAFVNFLTQYRSAEHTTEFVRERIAELKPKLADANGQFETGEQKTILELLPTVRFILVDQLYCQKNEEAEFLGPAIVRGISRLLRDFPRARDGSTNTLPEIVALSRAEDPGVIQQALRAGARDYALKSRLLALPGVLANVQRAVSEPPRNLHRNFRALYQLPNETIGLLQAVKIPRQRLHRAEKETGQKPLPGSLEIAKLLTILPKPDLHVHVGSCMSPQFLVVASLIGLLKHPARNVNANGVFAGVLATIDAFRKGAELDLVEELTPSKKKQNEMRAVHKGNTWICRVANLILGHLVHNLDTTEEDSESYTVLRAALHSELGVPDFLPKKAAKSKLESKPPLDLALFALRHSKSVNRAWKRDDLIRIYLLSLASSYTGEGGEKPTLAFLKKNFDFLSLFEGTARWDADAWDETRAFFYEAEVKSGANPLLQINETVPTVTQFRKSGWRWNPGFTLPFALEWPVQNAPCDFEASGPDPEKQPIEYELATGLRSTNLVDYLQGCEFSGAEHLRHPFLIHLYAQQMLLDFIRKGVFYTELKGSPDGFVNEKCGFEFPHVCRCLVEAFTQAQEVAWDVYQGSRMQPASNVPSGGVQDTAWIGDILGSRYAYHGLLNVFRSESDGTVSGNKAHGSCLGKRLPCKVSLIFVGKRHKSTREMILEAAAAAVMRPSGEQPVANARDFVDKEMRRCRVVGFDLAGREYDCPPELFADEFSRLSRLHIPLTIHAGENAPAKFIEDAILLLQAKRIGHGLALAEDQSLMTRVREDRVCIELCPICNHQTSHFTPPGRQSHGRPYPLKEFLEHGIYVTVNTDNPIISYTNMVKEYFQASYAYDKHGLSLWDALRIMRMGYVCSFLHLPERRAMIEMVEQYLFDLFSSEGALDCLRRLASFQTERCESHGNATPLV